MYTIKIKKESYYIPSGWYELTYGQWKDLQKTEESDKVLSILTGIPEKIVKKLDDKSLFNLNNLLSWINIKLNIDEYKAPESLVIKKGINKIELPLVQDIKEKTRFFIEEKEYLFENGRFHYIY